MNTIIFTQSPYREYFYIRKDVPVIPTKVGIQVNNRVILVLFTEKVPKTAESK